MAIRESYSPMSGRTAEQPASADDVSSRHFTSILTDPLFPPFCAVWAVIVTFPDRFPVTTPLPDTVAVLVFELDQKNV